MVEYTIIQLSPKELANFTSCDPIKITVNLEIKNLISLGKSHLSRKETAKLFDISLNCINHWNKKEILKPLKIGLREYFKKPDLLVLLFQ